MQAGRTLPCGRHSVAELTQFGLGRRGKARVPDGERQRLRFLEQRPRFGPLAAQSAEGASVDQQLSQVFAVADATGVR